MDSQHQCYANCVRDAGAGTQAVDSRYGVSYKRSLCSCFAFEGLNKNNFGFANFAFVYCVVVVYFAFVYCVVVVYYITLAFVHFFRLKCK